MWQQSLAKGRMGLWRGHYHYTVGHLARWLQGLLRSTPDAFQSDHIVMVKCHSAELLTGTAGPPDGWGRNLSPSRTAVAGSWDPARTFVDEDRHGQLLWRIGLVEVHVGRGGLPVGEVV